MNKGFARMSAAFGYLESNCTAHLAGVVLCPSRHSYDNDVSGGNPFAIGPCFEGRHGDSQCPGPQIRQSRGNPGIEKLGCSEVYRRTRDDDFDLVVVPTTRARTDTAVVARPTSGQYRV